MLLTNIDLFGQNSKLKPQFYTDKGTKLLTECSCEELRKNPDLTIKFLLTPEVFNYDKVNFIIDLNLKGNGRDDDDFLNYFEYLISYDKNDMLLYFKNQKEAPFVLLNPDNAKNDFAGNMVLSWNPAPKYKLFGGDPISLKHICSKGKKEKVAMGAWLKAATITSIYPQIDYSWKLIGESDLLFIKIKEEK